MLTFDEATHRYHFDGAPVPNVTRVLDYFCHSFDHVAPTVLENARQEGQAVHRTIEYYLRGTLDHENLPAWLHPYIEAFEQFRTDTGFELEASEQRLWHPLQQYAGTLDLVGWMNYAKLGRRHVLIDLKRSFAAGDAIGLQLAAYASAYNATLHDRFVAGHILDEGQGRIQNRFALRFRPEMSPPYATLHFTDANDFPTFHAMCVTYKYLEAHGKL